MLKGKLTGCKLGLMQDAKGAEEGVNVGSKSLSGTYGSSGSLHKSELKQGSGEHGHVEMSSVTG